MNLFLHLSIHVFLSLLAGFFVWRIWRRPLISFIGGFVGGVLVDLDHLIDYYLAFGAYFRLDYFLSGMSFDKNEKIYVLWHAWEYVIILIAVAAVFRNMAVKSLFLSLAFGLLLHLGFDVVMNHMPPRSYSIIYRLSRNFEMEKLIYIKR